MKWNESGRSGAHLKSWMHITQQLYNNMTCLWLFATAFNVIILQLIQLINWINSFIRWAKLSVFPVPKMSSDSKRSPAVPPFLAHFIKTLLDCQFVQVSQTIWTFFLLLAAHLNIFLQLAASFFRFNSCSITCVFQTLIRYWRQCRLSTDFSPSSPS